MHNRNCRLRLLTVPVLLILAGLACSLPGIARPTPTPTQLVPPPSPKIIPTPTPTPQALPPAIIEVDPPVGVELGLEEPLTFYFNQAMDRASVEAELRRQYPETSRFDWSGESTLAFYPGGEIQPEASLQVEFSAQVRAANGLVFSETERYNYQTVGYLRLAQALPEDGAVEVDPTSAVVATFNYPIVPLGADPTSLPPAFSLEPEVVGRGEWLNTSTYIFYPEPALDGGVTYTVQLNPELHSTDGSPLESAAGWSFSTIAPRLVAIEPQGLLELTGLLRIEFNQPMDIESLIEAFRLIGPDGEAVPGKFSLDPDPKEKTRLGFLADELLQRDADYLVEVSQEATSSGGTSLAEPVQAILHTYPDLYVAGTEPENLGTLEVYSSLGLVFSAPLQEENILDYISISPKVPDLNYWQDYDSNVLHLSGYFAPSTQYRLTVSGELRDFWGGLLGDDYNLTFRSASLQPDLYTATGSDVLFLTSTDNQLRLQATNLSQIRLSLSELSFADFQTMIGLDSYNFREGYVQVDPVKWQQRIEMTPERAQSVAVYLSPDRIPLNPGIYYLNVDLQAGRNSRRDFLLVVSDVQVTFKYGAADVLVWATHFEDQTAIPGVQATVYDEKGRQLVSGITDTQGIFRSEYGPLENPYQNLIATIGNPGEPGFGLTLSTWNQGMQAWEFGLYPYLKAPGLKVYFYTDRPIYRPGQTVYFRAVARQAFNARYAMPDLEQLTVTITDGTGQRVSDLDLPLSAFGTASGQYILPSEAQPGYYNISLESDPGESLYFQVAEYRKPEINLQVNFSSDEVLNGEDLKATVEARYFFDAPAGNLKVNWTLYALRSSFYLPGYQVGVSDASWLSYWSYPWWGDMLGQQIQSGEAETGADGLLHLTLPTTSQDIPKDKLIRYTLEVSVEDESGLPVSGRASANVNPATFYIGLRPDAWIGQAGEMAGFEVQVVDWDKQPAGEHTLQAEFRKVTWKRTDPPPERSWEGPTYEPIYTSVDSSSGATNAEGKARLSFTPPEPGTYQLRVSGDGAVSELLLWVGGQGQAVWPNLPNKRLRIVVDKEEYKPGEVARLFITSPFKQPAQALLTIERGIILRYEIITLQLGGNDIELPLSADDAPNIYISLLVLGKNEGGLTDYRQGYQELDITPVEQVLQVKLVSQPERAGPGDEVTFDLQVSDSRGEPVQGEFSLAVVDLAALALADPNAQSITDAFYGRQTLGVSTGASVTAYARLDPLSSPGGMGGGGDGVTPVVRERFPDTAYWNTEIVTDAQGQAQVSLVLPDTLTTWQVEARGLTEDTRVGDASTELVTSKELIVRPVTPRFLVVGDHVLLAAIVQNNTDRDLTTLVALQPTGFTLDDPASARQEAFVPAGGRARVEWWGTAGEEEKADLVFSVQTTGDLPDLTDAARPALGALPILRYNARQTFRTSGTLAEASERLELVSLPRSFDARSGELRVELSGSLASSMLKDLVALEEMDFDSNEPILSNYLANLEIYRTLREFGLPAPELEARLDKKLKADILYLQSNQREDGGWGWSVNSESNYNLTAYILFGLARGQNAGATIDQQVVNNAIDYLQTNLPNPEKLKETWQLDRLAFAQFALSELKAIKFVDVMDLYEYRGRLNPWAQALLALTLERLEPGIDESRSLLSDLQATAIRSATGVHWEILDREWENMITPISNSAIVVYGLAQRDPNSPLLSEAVRYLMAHRQTEGGWESTYTTAWTLIALGEVLKGTGEMGGDFDYQVTLNGALLASGEASGADLLTTVTAQTPVTSLMSDAPNALLLQRSAGSGRLYYTAGLQVARPVEDVAPLSQGLSLQRFYYPATSECAEEACPAIYQAQAGEKVKVRLVLTLPHDIFYMRLEDHIPAGAEIQDPRLKTSQQGEEFVDVEMVREETEPFDTHNPFLDGWGWWLFSSPQVYDDAIAWSADFLAAGTYEITYTITLVQPGAYRVMPGRAWQSYFPEVQANSAGEIFTVK